jgi:hypothetical protein
MKSKDELLLELVQSHAAFERSLDLAGTMSTVSDDPVWEFHPLGIRVEGRDAVAKVYERQFIHLLPFVESGTYRNTFFSDTGMCMEGEYRVRLPSGLSSVAHALISFSFEEGRVSSERTYVSGRFVTLLVDTFDAELRSIPGVISLSNVGAQP